MTWQGELSTDEALAVIFIISSSSINGGSCGSICLY